ncbi:hypothetical protein F5888DRAFT_1907347 [Russula emetica]|nr:hypothetical protein F5888DRAFT_1907347 [Russula emetica]
MISMQRVLLKLIRILRFVRDYIVGRAAGRWSLFTAFLCRRMSELRRSWNRKPGTSRNPGTAEPLPPGNRASSYSASGSSAVLREYVVAASTVPGRLAASSASLASFHDEDAGQSASLPPSPTTSIPPAILSVHQPHPLYGRNRTASSSSNLSGGSAQSRAGERLSTIVNSPELLHAPVDQLSRYPRAFYPQFGPGVDPSTSRGQLARSPSPTHQQNITHSDSRLAITTTYVHPHPYDGDEGRSPVVHPSSSSSIHEPLRPLTNRNMWSGSSPSINVYIQCPSSDSLPTSLMEESMAMDPAHSTPSYSAMDQSETASQHPTIASSAASEFHLPEGRFLQMIHSDQIPRYENVTIPRKKKKLFLKPLTTTFPYFPNSSNPDQASGRQNCAPWKAATHPEGALYFYDPQRRLFTDTDMYNTDLRKEMERFYLYLEKIIRVEKLTIPSKKNNYDLVLDIMRSENQTIQWSYYFACHKARCLFWLDKYDSTSGMHGVESPAHISGSPSSTNPPLSINSCAEHHLEGLYWNHWSLYPAVFKGRRLPLHVYDELIGMLAHGCVDTLTSKFSTLPYDDEKMQKMISLVQNAKGAKAGLEHHTVVTTRLLCFFAHWRFVYFHGQRHARLLRNQTVYDEPKLSSESSRLIRFLSPLLFFAPEVHLREMKELWADEIVLEIVWKKFMTKLHDDWSDFVLWSTVMLAVSVSFLTIPGVIFSSTNGGTLKSVHQEIILPSSSQIACTLSAEASIGSIVIGMLLVRQSRSNQELDPSDASTYLYQNSHSIFGLEPLAIVFGIPWALLLWSMVTFSVALLLFCFVVSNLWTRLFIALTSFLLLTFTLWCIWTRRDTSSDWGTVPARLNFLSNVVESVRPASLASDDGTSSRRSPSSSRGDVSGV